MPWLFDRLNSQKEKDRHVLADFVSIFCRENHRDGTKGTFPIRDDGLRRGLGGKNRVLCQDCQKLLNHGIVISINTTSGTNCSTLATASSPSPAFHSPTYF